MILVVSKEGLHFERFLNENYFHDKEAILEELEAYTNTDQNNISKKNEFFHYFLFFFMNVNNNLYQDYMIKQQDIE